MSSFLRKKKNNPLKSLSDELQREMQIPSWASASLGATAYFKRARTRNFIKCNIYRHNV